MKNREKENSFVRDGRKLSGVGKKAAYLAIALIAVLGFLDREEDWKKWQKEEKGCQQM